MRENSTFKETTILDYIPKIKQVFPDLEESDIKKILEYGWRLIYIACIAGCDVLITSTHNHFWFYIGSLFKNSMKHYRYYRNKLIRKMKFLYKRTNPEWDGYYYTAITEEEFKQFNSKGRKRKHFTFTLKKSFKFKDPCIIYYPHCKYIIKFKYLIDKGFDFYKDTLHISNAELVEQRNPSLFKDILVSNNDYELLC